MIQAYSLVIFDWDGTLVNSVDWIAACIEFAAESERLPHPERSAIHDVIGMSLAGAMQELFATDDVDLIQRLVKHYRRQYLSHEITPADLFPAVEAVLAELRGQGKVLAIATGKGRGGLDKAIAGTGIGHYFQTSICADEAHSKPNPHMILELLRRTGFDSDQTVMIGDSNLDMEMAQKAQTGAIGVTYGVHDAARLQQFSPLACIDDLSELLRG